MIGRSHRFHGSNALKRVYSGGRTIRGAHMSLKYKPSPRRQMPGHVAPYRAAVVVSRKVHKSAVVRNRIRRRLYEVIRGQEVQMQGSFDLVLTVYSEQVALLPAVELREIVISQLQAAGVVRSGGERPRAIVETKEHS